MSREEEVLLELVLDNFSNIREVLNATKDIENFLIKLKLLKNRGGIGVIFEKVKNLVDSLYDHSVKVKGEFYEHYNKLQKMPIEKKNSQENIITQDDNNVDTVEGNSTAQVNSEPILNEDPLLNVQSAENDENSSKGDKNNSEPDTSESSNIAVTESTDKEDAAIENVDNTNVQNEDTVLKKPVKDTEENNCSEMDKEINNDSIVEDSNESEKENPLNDPLDIKENSSDNIVDSNIVDDNHSDTDKGNEGECVSEDGDDDETNPEKGSVKTEPRIRLVDLSKLIDPKPKKSVKFDTSIIILTSSDEESNTPKKKSDVKDRNGKLKPALKTSSDKNISHNIDESDFSSSDRRKEKKNKSKDAKSEKKKTLLENNKSSDIDKGLRSERNSKVNDKSNKSKHNKADKSRNKEYSSDSEISDEEPSKKKKKSSKAEEKINDMSDLSDCLIQETSDSENKEETEACNSRRSRRINKKQNEKEKQKEKLKTLFKRKIGRHGTSCFQIVNKKSDTDKDNNTDSDNTRKHKSRKKKDLVEEHLTDTSSLSSDENEVTEENKSVTKKRKYKSFLPSTSNSSEDKKFTYEVYIPLPLIECDRLKEIYLRNKDILEVKRLTKMNLPQSSKRSRKTKSDSKSSSDTEKPKSKKSKSATSDEEFIDEHISDDEPLTNLLDKIVADIKDTTDETDTITSQVATIEKPIENEDDRMADIIMDKMQSSDVEESEEKKSEENNTESEKEQNKESSSSTEKHVEEKTPEKTSENETEKQEEVIAAEEAEPKDEDASEKKDKEEDDKKSEDDISSDSEKKKDKKKWRRDKLLTTKIDSTDSEEEFSKYNKRKEKSREELMSDDEIKSPITSKRKTKKRAKKVVIRDSDESDSDKNKSDSSYKSKESKESSSSNSDDEKEEENKKPARRRIKRTRNSSSSSDEDRSTRKNIRKVIGKDALSETTKQAEAEEKERKARIAEKQKKYNQIFESLSESKVERVVLDYNEKKKTELLSVHKGIVKKLKPHQASGIQFMWNACFESLERTKSTTGSGCILAHCMGLGKTLQVIALAHTLLTNSAKTGVEKIMVVCPLNTVLNWKAEFKQWMPRSSQIEVYELVSCKQNYERQYKVQEWHSDGGVLIIGYAMFRNISNPNNKRISKQMRKVFQEGLVDPGPDLIVCDEGHLLKNEKTNLSIAMNRVKTLRRIVLTGTPLQNNLKEYWCMVQFIKPNLLGTYKEYLNRFVNPITNGQYTDSTQHDIILMRKRSHVLHKLLDGVVQRRDYSVLEPYLPPKYEYVLFVSLTECQVKLYKHYMERFARQSDGSNRTSFLFTDFQQLQRICTHPRVLFDKAREKREKGSEDSDSEGSLKDFIDDGEGSATPDSSSSKSGSDSEGSDSDDHKEKKSKQQKTRVTRAQAALRRENNEDSEPEPDHIPKEWWQEYCDGDELDNINNSGKLFLLFQILKECEEIGDKILVFSQSLYTLNCIEYFLEKIDAATQDGSNEKIGGHTGSWSLGLDYFRLDGSSSCDNRATWCNSFNNPDNPRARLFLISTKAGGLGINLVAANRVIIFDVSWNPSHDIQSIYRVYRFGQTKPCYIYRFVSYGTMEMKTYERQVTKQAISKRVIDEQQIDRHYNQNDLAELYKCDLDPKDRPIPLVPKDVLLGELLQKYEKSIFKYHLHQSLLENKEDEGLNEEERKAAWEEFENEKVLRKTTNSGVFNNYNMNAHAIAAALASIVRKDNPNWSDIQIKGIIPALVQQLQVQLTEGDLSMYTRVQKEMQMMQALQAQKMKEAYYQQQVMRMIQQQQERAKILGNMNVDPVHLARAQANLFNNHLANALGGPSSAPAPRQMSNDVIELND